MKKIRKIAVTVTFEDDSTEIAETDGNEFFVPELMVAQEKEKPVAGAVLYLADQGVRLGNPNTVSWQAHFPRHYPKTSFVSLMISLRDRMSSRDYSGVWSLLGSVFAKSPW